VEPGDGAAGDSLRHPGLQGRPLVPRQGELELELELEPDRPVLQVEKVVRGRIVLVTYVDFGNTEVVSLHRLRRLFPEFLAAPLASQAVQLKVEEQMGKLHKVSILC
jgi:hypothetical protein